MIRLVLPMPPSVNRLWRRSKNGGMYKVQAARDFGDEVWVALCRMPNRPDVKAPVRAELCFVFANNRRVDADNRIKVTLDALSKLLGFDDKDVIELKVTKEIELGGHARCEVTIGNVEEWQQ